MRGHRRARVTVGHTARDDIDEYAGRAHPRETGGLLLGWWDDQGVHVIAAAEVTDPRATGVRWTRSQSTAQQVLERAIEAISDPMVGYVGDWHSHPAAVGPSPPDRAALVRVSRQYTTPVVLVVHRSDGRLDVLTAQSGRIVRSTVQDAQR